jgi:hypothetical protein
MDCIDPNSVDNLTPSDIFNYHLKAGGLATQAYYPSGFERGDECLWNLTMDGV